MEERAIDNDKNLTEAVQNEGKVVNLNHDSDKTNKSKLSLKPKPGNIYKSRTCSYYYNNGYCKFGDSCRYKHLKKRYNNAKHVAKQKSTVTIKNVNENENIEDKESLQNLNTQTSSKHTEQGETSREEVNLKYLDSVEDCSNGVSHLNLLSPVQRIQSRTYLASNRPLKKQNKPLCYYYKKGLCYKGDSCKYYHQNKNGLSSTVVQAPNILKESDDSSLLLPYRSKSESLVNEKSAANRPIPVLNKPLNTQDLSSLTLEAICELRTTEINQLKKRFPRFEIIKENQTFSIMFQPSDPDWAFDVKSLKLEVNFPEKYPTEICKITVIQDSIIIPGLLIKFLNKAICEWMDKKFGENIAANKTELMFRVFLKWFDKNLEDLFITGLKKVKQDLKAKEDGIEFVPVEDLFSSPKNDTTEEFCDKSAISPDSSELHEQVEVSNDKISQPLANQSNKLPYIGNNGMKIIFSGLEFTEGAVAFICTKISVTLQCCRCKTSFNKNSVPKKNNCHVCSKCSKNVGFTFDPATVHQFSSVLGNLHLLDCVAVDINLIECHFLVDCLNCSKQNAVDGIHYGQKHKMWCIYCNEKMMISIGGVKFQALKLSSVPDGKYLPLKKTEKKVKDPVVKEGEPLPNFGACRHYKKSFRWLRFPCCGRLYPCDECHNEKETDHEMKYASRMMCGFCSKEQPYSREKPCLLCSQDMTKKSGSHWEGGKGCRNRIQMSREDKQKYSGISKTVSRKAQTAKLKKKH